jgi:predicted NAD/FAD-binding protein
MRIAVIGAGVSGLGAAWALKDVHEVSLFEKEPRPGGHANTLTIDYGGAEIDVDTGFIVFNRRNYPYLTALLDHLEVKTFASDMSFSISDPDGFEWSSNGLAGMFAWKRNMAKPEFLCMLGDIVRFSAQARADLRGNRINGSTLEEYVAGLRLGRGFLEQYLLPMGAAIWSTPERDMLRYPALSFLNFCENHRLLHALRPRWRSVVGGSKSYVEALRTRLGPRVRCGEGVLRVVREQDGVIVHTARGAEHFDQAILACHSDETAAILETTPRERAALDAIRYAPNTAYLHRDASLMPRRRAAWASWNYLRGRCCDASGVCVSYWMNRLQNIDRRRPLFVTLNPPNPPREDLTFARLSYDHPQFDRAALEAQNAIEGQQGVYRVWFAGAWLGHGFHEDGLASGLRIARRLGARLPWETHAAAPARAPVWRPAEAAA